MKDAILFAKTSAINAKIKGMKACNSERLQNGLAPAYREDSFFEKAQEIRDAIEEAGKEEGA